MKRDKYLDLVWENMKVTGIPTVTTAAGTITKVEVEGLEDLAIREHVETSQTTALLRSPIILRRVLKTWCCSNSSEKASAKDGVKNSQKSKIIILSVQTRIYPGICNTRNSFDFWNMKRCI